MLSHEFDHIVTLLATIAKDANSSSGSNGNAHSSTSADDGLLGGGVVVQEAGGVGEGGGAGGPAGELLLAAGAVGVGGRGVADGAVAAAVGDVAHAVHEDAGVRDGVALLHRQSGSTRFNIKDTASLQVSLLLSQTTSLYLHPALLSQPRRIWQGRSGQVMLL